MIHDEIVCSINSQNFSPWGNNGKPTAIKSDICARHRLHPSCFCVSRIKIQLIMLCISLISFWHVMG